MDVQSDHIIGIIGKSGSGKTFIAEYFRRKGFNVIDSYTNRPKRFENETGHIFISTEEVENYREEMIAYTFFDNYHYFATRSQYRNKGITFYVIDPVGVKTLEEEIKDAKFTFIYINVDESIRRERMLKRYKISKELNEDDLIKIDTIKRRLDFDKKAFSIVKCDYTLDNNDHTIDIIREIEKLIAVII